ncbi:MAG: hypothetical protein KHZ77_04305 [Veillonella sp.]|uniref:hypothetical protein n=1 Tax=Veillonella sp. TaxID=1926307 RepID=UPI0025D7368B|nr:hypothetical protein [Veillonella sp.]MBS4913371.1 hypothetical protein [Veillonella sp.]
MQIQYEEILNIIINYIIPIVSFLFSGIALHQSIKSRKTEEKIKKLELFIKEYEAKQIEAQQNIPSQPYVEARVYKVSHGVHKMKIWNSGRATAYNISASIPEKYNITVINDKFPYEYLKPNQNFEVDAYFYLASSSKFEVRTFWEDEKGERFSNEELRSI